MWSLGVGSTLGSLQHLVAYLEEALPQIYFPVIVLEGCHVVVHMVVVEDVVGMYLVFVEECKIGFEDLHRVARIENCLGGTNLIQQMTVLAYHVGIEAAFAEYFG